MIKHIRRLGIFAASLAALLGCKSSAISSGTPQAVEVHLQTQFRGEQIRVDIDGQKLFGQAVTTNDVLGLAEIIKLEMLQGRHEIKIIINGRFQQKASFKLDCKLYIGVTYYRDAVPALNLPQGLTITLTDIPYRYD